MNSRDKSDVARLLSEVIERSAQAMAALIAKGELSSIEIMHLRGSREQFDHIIALASK